MTEIIHPIAAHNPRSDRALLLAHHGYAVFPVRPDGSKAPYSDDTVSTVLGVPPPPTGLGGCRLATLDPTTIARLWTAFPDAWIGIAAGAASGGLIVLDSDEKNDKSGSATIQANGYTLTSTAWQQTLTGGHHYLYRAPPGTHCPTDSGALGSGLDRRGDGGYIVDYGFDVATPLAPAPLWLTTGGTVRTDRQPLGSLCAPSFDAAHRALFGIDNPDSYDEWRNVGMAYRQCATGLADEATVKDAFNEWCAQYEKNDLADNEKLWRSMDDGTAIGWQYLYGRTPAVIKAEITLGFIDRSRDIVQPLSIFFPATAFDGTTPAVREWLVNDIVPIGTVTLLGGDGGTGKSLLALQLAVSSCLNRLWINRFVVGGPALYVSAEDDRDEIHRRLTDITRLCGVTIGDLKALTLASLAGQDALLATLGRDGVLQPSKLFHDLETQVAAITPRLVVLDTLADLFPGNENDRAQARQFIGMLRGLAIRHKCAVVLLSHPSLSGLNSGAGTSGSTAWSNSVRSRLYFERIAVDGYESNVDARRLKVLKSNYGRTGAEITVTYREGMFVADPTSGGTDNAAKAEQVFLALLGTFSEQGRFVNASSGPNYAPSIFAAHPGSEGMTKRALKSAMENLFSAKRIKISEIMENGKSRKFIEIA
ncbi:AAA family ATPase [Sphingomonas sp. R86520]|uniref:AAA family ATPase n=1 Tax=Sphingomonas sp. R86520 TaxID=3093859 RepID=UPI0036D3CA00